MRCPLCRKDVVETRAKPFCSERCRTEDLNKWLDGEYRIPGEPLDPHTLAEVAGVPDREDFS
jgi:endogenous inhibitor of DNA gyrase (YacG/DUF329 family)